MLASEPRVFFLFLFLPDLVCRLPAVPVRAHCSHARLPWHQSSRVQIQIILHFLLLSLPGERAAAPAPAEAEAEAQPLSLPPSLSPSKPKPKKRKRREREAQPEQLPPPLEERLESYMDKMATWQLMQTVDSSLDRTQGTRPSNGKGKDKEKEQDGRDWMQAFCEDVVEPLYVFHVPHP